MDFKSNADFSLLYLFAAQIQEAPECPVHGVIIFE